MNSIRKLRKIWTEQDMTNRLIELAWQSMYYLIITLGMLGFAGSTAQRFLGADLWIPCTSFIAVVYLPLMLKAVAREFDESRKRYLLEQIQTVLDELRDFEMKQGCR